MTLKPGVGVIQVPQKMALFDIHVSYTTFYWSTSISIALCCTILSYLMWNNRDLEIWVSGPARSFKVVPF